MANREDILLAVYDLNQNKAVLYIPIYQGRGDVSQEDFNIEIYYSDRMLQIVKDINSGKIEVTEITQTQTQKHLA